MPISKLVNEDVCEFLGKLRKKWASSDMNELKEIVSILNEIADREPESIPGERYELRNLPVHRCGKKYA